MTRLRLIAAALILASSLSAETVYLTSHGKTFHESEKCMSLSRATVKLTADRKQAEAHGLKQCGICYRPKKTAKAGNDWAKPVDAK